MSSQQSPDENTQSPSSRVFWLAIVTAVIAFVKAISRTVLRR
jgi:hypothetical protein